jgi:hypothetical protein
MSRRSLLWLSALWMALAFLAPLAGLADSCQDCLWTPGNCCAASGCPCCIHGSSVLTHVSPPELSPASMGITPDALPDRCLSADPRDVFHVPKSPLA